MSQTELPPNELVFRKRILQAIHDGVNMDGMTTADVVITIISLTRIVVQGAIVACPMEKRPELHTLFHRVITTMADDLRDFEPTSEEEALVKGKQAASAWGNKREVH